MDTTSVAEQKTTHTRGPWHIGFISNPLTNPRVSIWGPPLTHAQSGEWIAKDVTPANASLIAAAPDLLDALKGVLSALRQNAFGDEYSDWAIKFLPRFHALAAATVAIEKAEGGA